MIYFTTIETNKIYAQNNKVNVTDHRFHSYVEQMIGHINASIDNKRNNNITLAIQHALHPVEEIWDKMEYKLSQNGSIASNKILDKLQNYIKILKNDSTTEAIEEKVKLTELLRTTINQYVPEEKRLDNKYILNVTADLIDTAQKEYGESMIDGKIVNIIEYQDGQEFFEQAISLLKESYNLLTDSQKKVLVQIEEIKKDVDSKSDPSYVTSDVKDLVCKIKGGIYC